MPYDATDYSDPALEPVTKIAPATDDAVTELLRRARNKVRWGWCQGSMHAEVFGVWPQYCALGSLQVVAGFTSAQRREAEERLQQTLLRLGHGHGVAAYNDDPVRKQREVVQLFTEAIRGG